MSENEKSVRYGIFISKHFLYIPYVIEIILLQWYKWLKNIIMLRTMGKFSRKLKLSHCYSATLIVKNRQKDFVLHISQTIDRNIISSRLFS